MKQHVLEHFHFIFRFFIVQDFFFSSLLGEEKGGGLKKKFGWALIILMNGYSSVSYLLTGDTKTRYLGYLSNLELLMVF